VLDHDRINREKGLMISESQHGVRLVDRGERKKKGWEIPRIQP